MTDYGRLLACSDEELAHVDPLKMNLLVAKSVPCLAGLDIDLYREQADRWAADVQQWLPIAEREFHQTPEKWKNDINFFRLGVLCRYLEFDAKIACNEDQRDGALIEYTNPSDLFLNGVMDRRRGTCGNMAVLHVAIGWRLGWPVSLACVKRHFVCRYDDGRITHNIEATQAGYGGFKSDPDEYLAERYGLPPVAISSGSDLRALKPREMLGVFLGFRGRHMRDTGRWDEAEADFLLARHLFPRSRQLYVDAMAMTLRRGASLFEPPEVGSLDSLPELIIQQRGIGQPVFPASVQVILYGSWTGVHETEV